MIKKIRLLSCITACLVLLTACGWQLRGVGSNSGYFSKSRIAAGNAELDIDFVQRNVELRSIFNKILKQSKIELTDRARVTLVIDHENLDRRALAVTDTGVTAQYQLVLTIRFGYVGELKTETTQVSTWRNYDFDPKLISAKSQEEQALITEMREELVVRILAAAQ